MQEHRRNGWYVLGAALMAAGTAWLVGWGVAVASAKKDSSTHFWVPASVAAVAVCVLGFLIISAVMYDLPGRFRKRGTPSAAHPASAPVSKTFGKITVRGRGIVDVDSSADIFADDGMQVADNAYLGGRHVPGHPELVIGAIESTGGQEGKDQEEEGAGGAGDGELAEEY